MSGTLSHMFDLAIDIAKLPVASLDFRLDTNPHEVRRLHAHCTKPHPKYKIFQNKALGAALIDLKGYDNPDEYMRSIKGHNSAEHHARRARTRGYVVAEIVRNDYIDELHAINTSLDSRQGRPMDQIYQHKETQYPCEPNFRYFGVFNAAGKLTAYSNLGFYGNFAAFERLLGLRNNDGAMHLMLTDIVCQLIAARTHAYLMYDTYFGASPGLKTFKKMIGFKPYRVKYSLQ